MASPAAVLGPQAMKSTHSSRRAPAQQQQVLGARRAVGGSCAAALAAWSAATAPVPARRDPCTTQAVAAPEAPPPAAAAADSRSPPLKVVIAGAGIGGLVLAVGLLKRGFDVTVLERDMTAIRGEGKYRGPIQVRCKAWPGVACGAVSAADDTPRAPVLSGVPAGLLRAVPTSGAGTRGCSVRQIVQCTSAHAWRRLWV